MTSASPFTASSIPCSEIPTERQNRWPCAIFSAIQLSSQFACAHSLSNIRKKINSSLQIQGGHGGNLLPRFQRPNSLILRKPEACLRMPVSRRLGRLPTCRIAAKEIARRLLKLYARKHSTYPHFSPIFSDANPRPIFPDIVVPARQSTAEIRFEFRLRTYLQGSSCCSDYQTPALRTLHAAACASAPKQWRGQGRDV